MSELAIKPGLRLGSYPQRVDSGLSDFEQAVNGWIERQHTRLKRKRYSQRYISGKVQRYAEALQNCSDEEFDVVLEELRLQLHCQGLQEALIIESFAVIREAAGRVLGKRHFDTIAQVVEGNLLVGQVHDIRLVPLAALLCIHAIDYRSTAQAKALV